jgi:hypothetical protein
MRTVSFILGLLLLIPSVASARVDVFVHGRNQGPANTADYWHNGGYSDNGITAFTGNNSEGNFVYSYNASYSWSNLSSNTMPVCALTKALDDAPGTDMAVLSHSAGGAVVAYMMAIAQNGWAHSCAVAPATARPWVTYFLPIASPFRGTEVANAVYGNTSGNWFQSTCAWVAGSIANLVFNETSEMTWALQTSNMNSMYAQMTAYGSFSAIYEQIGRGNGGDDSTGLWWAQYCSNIEGSCGLLCTPANDGIVSQNSAAGCARGTTIGTQCLPGGHFGWTDTVGHSSNRRNNYQTFAANVWSHNPY